jgi:uncharacterized protein (UPF0332 family)
MSFDWAEYLALAKELIENPTIYPEARQRSAVSRAYYAAFNLAKNYLEQAEEQSLPKTADAHRYVAEYFRLSDDPDQREIGNNLARLRLFRNQADYTSSFPGLSAVAKRTVKIAAGVAANLKALRN